jgi:hypothetical protein
MIAARPPVVKTANGDARAAVFASAHIHPTIGYAGGSNTGLAEALAVAGDYARSACMAKKVIIPT